MTTTRTGLTGRKQRLCIRGRMRPRTARPGVALAWVAIMGVMLITLVGLAMDAAVAYLAGSQLQIAADAASLAGARLVRDADLALPRDAARAISLQNKAVGTPVDLDRNDANAATGEIVIGRHYRFSNSAYCADQSPSFCCPTPPCFDPSSTSPNAMRVRARRITGSPDGQIPLVFGAAPLIGVTGVNVSRMSTAMISGGTGAGLITLDPSGECSLELSGNVIIDLTSAPGWDGDTAAQINSDDPCALCGDGSSFEFHAPETNIVGMDPGYCFNGDPTLDTYINPDSPIMPDPLADYDPPSIGIDLGAIDPATDDPTYYPPGYYSGGMKISGQKKVVMGPGVYVVEGSGAQGGFQTSGHASVIANNVMIYIKSGKLDLGGTGQTTITPMTEEVNTDPYYIGIAIFQARDNPEPARIIGTADMDLQGTYYFPNNLLEVGGTGIALGNQLIAWQLDLHGDGNFAIQYDGRFPSPGSRVFLVE